MSESTTLETKLAAARTRLILDKPFLGSLVMHLPLKAADPKWCKTTATDAKSFYYNPAYIDRLSLEQTQFVLAHEAMHCALSHFARRNHRQKHRWDVACDYAVNMILDDERMRGPENALMSAAYRGLTAEEIYPVLHEDPPEETQDTHLFDNDSSEGGDGEPQEQDSGEGQGQSSPKESGGAGDSERQEEGEASPQSGESQRAPPPPSDPGKLDEQWKARLAAAAQMARQAGKLSPSLMRLVDELLAPQLPWRAMLARYMMNAARDDYSFQRTSRRESIALMPRLHSQSVDVVVALDTSGSVQAEELREFLAEIDALKGQVRANVTLHACDDKLDANGPWRFAQWEAMKLPEAISGGGGTDFRPLFDWVERENINPDLLVYFTDAQGHFPECEPHFPVVWLVKGKSGVPFGTRIQLN
ncbi:MAG: VWA-like domain-containing protein [Pseudomonadota bacterium]|nr:VWA-like domain-containing protein [Pseudomonadota bacterium]MDP1905414.1 VWA-like domain-containing protein [Pseudomonadota bacterium]MDP2354130.1 VWA-like domain-containing protein [Pseudomonadota bacterium]